MSRDDYMPRTTDPESSSGNHRWRTKGLNREEQVLRTLGQIERLERRRWYTCDEITDAWNRTVSSGDQRQRSHVSKNLSVLVAKGLVVGEQFHSDKGRGPLLLHFRLPLAGEDVRPATKTKVHNCPSCKCETDDEDAHSEPRTLIELHQDGQLF